MLDETEYTIAQQLYKKAFRELDREFKELLDYYNNVTGFNETEPNAIMHHRIAQYGPDCEQCKKPYRTPKASFCAACGNKRKI